MKLPAHINSLISKIAYAISFTKRKNILSAGSADSAGTPPKTPYGVLGVLSPVYQLPVYPHA